ncbi:ABC transporter substrate-binding protein [Allobacillus sp. GCM10007491]|nr:MULTISPECIES: ABC transporter substrate-binding protein [Allobacillus]
MYVNHEVPVLRREGYEADYFNLVDNGVPSYYEIVTVASEDSGKMSKQI